MNGVLRMLGQRGLRHTAMPLAAVALIAMAILHAWPALSGNRQAIGVSKGVLAPIEGSRQLGGQDRALTGMNPEMMVWSAVLAGNTSLAEVHLRQLLASSTSGEGSRLWALRLLRTGAGLRDYAAAEGTYILATRIAPDDAQVWYELASFYEIHSQPDRALAAYLEGSQADPQLAATGYLRSGMILRQLGKCPEALKLFDQSEAADTALPQLPDWARGTLYFYMGDCLKRLQNWEATLVAFESVLSVSQPDGWPRYAAYLGMGDVWVEKGNMAKAREAYESALQSAGEDVNRSVVYKALGRWYQALGEIDQALLAFEQAVQLNPEDPWAYVDLAMIYEQLQQPDQAAMRYRAALRIDPQMTFAQHALDRLEVSDAGNTR